VVEFAEQETCLGLGHAQARIDAHTLHPGEVEHQPFFAHRGTGHAMPTAVD